MHLNANQVFCLPNYDNNIVKNKLNIGRVKKSGIKWSYLTHKNWLNGNDNGFQCLALEMPDIEMQLSYFFP